MAKFEKLMEKKGSSEMDPEYKESKMAMLQELKKQMMNMMHGDATGRMKKVEVAADDKQGLTEGLDKAKELVSGKELPDMSDLGKDGMSDDSDESSEDESDPAEELTDNIEEASSKGELSDDEIQQLEALLDKLKQSKMR